MTDWDQFMSLKLISTNKSPKYIRRQVNPSWNIDQDIHLVRFIHVYNLTIIFLLKFPEETVSKIRKVRSLLILSIA